MTKVKVAVIAILAALTLGALVVPTIAQQGPPPGHPGEDPGPRETPGPPGPDHPPDHAKGYPPDAPPKGPRDLPKGQDR